MDLFVKVRNHSFVLSVCLTILFILYVVVFCPTYHQSIDNFLPMLVDSM